MPANPIPGTLNHYQAGAWTVIEAGRDLDVYTVPEFRDKVTRLLENLGCDRLVVDLTSTVFLDATGFGVLVGALKRAREHGGTLRLVCTNERILRVLRTTGLNKVLDAYETVAVATSAEEVAPGA